MGAGAKPRRALTSAERELVLRAEAVIRSTVRRFEQLQRKAGYSWEDLRQEGWLAVCVCAQTYQGRGSWEGCARRAVFGHMLRLWKFHTRPQRDVRTLTPLAREEELPQESHESASDPRRGLLALYMDKLTSGQKAAVMLTLEGLRPRQVAAHMGRSPAKVYRFLASAAGRLRQALERATEGMLDSHDRMGERS